MKMLRKNLVECSSPEARWLLSGTLRTGTYHTFPENVPQLFKRPSTDSSHAASWVAKTRKVIEAHEAGTPQFRLGVSTPYQVASGRPLIIHL